MLEHRNSQKRIYIADACYFITCVTQNRFPYFKEEIFCELFLENLRICKRLKEFKLYGWFLGYDHFHWQIEPGDRWNYSKIMHCFKRNITRDINKIMNPHFEGDVPQRRRYYPVIGADMDPRLRAYHDRWVQKYPTPFQIPKFHWQKSFHDHYLRNERDFMTHLEYISWNPIKHALPEDWPYVFTNKKYADLLDEF